jgi:CRISPR-associated protein Cas1
MIKRIIDISEPAYLHLKQKQLLIDKEGETVASIPVEDLGVVVLEHPQIVVTQSVIIACQQNNVALIFCDQRHLPYSLLLPVSDGHTLHNKVLRQQVEVSVPIKKRLWQQIVRQKIEQQVKTLERAEKETCQLERLATKVKSGDPENIEAQAAKKYWATLFGEEFRRNIEEGGVNALLNYGYSIVRAMVARAVVGAGLHPALGLFHQNQYNGLCLADDLMEPFRPWVDWQVYRLLSSGADGLEITRETKTSFLQLPAAQVYFGGKSMPLMVACHYLVNDLKRAFENRSQKLRYPEWPEQMSLL